MQIAAPLQSTKKFWRWFILGIVALIILLFLLSITRMFGNIKNMIMGFPPPLMRVIALEQKDAPILVSGIGHVEPYSTVSLKPRVEGQIKEIPFKEGQNVTKGDLMFTIDPAPFEAALQIAAANLARDKALAEQARKEVVRSKDLLEKQFVSQNDYESLQSKQYAAEATVKADESYVTQAQLNLAFCRIEAPISGRTGNLIAYVGNTVRSFDNSALVTITQTQPIYVTFTAPEQKLPAIRKAQKDQKGNLKVEALDTNGALLATGELTFIDNQVDRATGTITLKATFLNQDETLWPGQFVNVQMTLGTEAGAKVIPSRCIQTGPAGKFIYRIREAHPHDFDPKPGTQPIGEGFDPMYTDNHKLQETTLIAVQEPNLQRLRKALSTGKTFSIKAADLKDTAAGEGEITLGEPLEKTEGGVSYFKADFSEIGSSLPYGRFVKIAFTEKGQTTDKPVELVFAFSPIDHHQPAGKLVGAVEKDYDYKLTGPILVAEQVMVKTDRMLPGEESVLTSDTTVSPEDWVVVEGQMTLYPLAQVNVLAVPGTETKAEAGTDNKSGENKSSAAEKTDDKTPAKSGEEPVTTEGKSK